LLYAHLVGSLFLYLVARPHDSISVMRRQADQLAARLAKSKKIYNSKRA